MLKKLIFYTDSYIVLTPFTNHRSLEKYSILFPEKGHFFLISLIFLECSGEHVNQLEETGLLIW